jgi:hypothetical protein
MLHALYSYELVLREAALRPPMRDNFPEECRTDHPEKKGAVDAMVRCIRKIERSISSRSTKHDLSMDTLWRGVFLLPLFTPGESLDLP